MISSPPSSPRRGVTLATVLSLAFSSVLLLCGAGNVPVKNFLPQGAMQGDLNAGGHALTNVATLCTTNLISATGLTSTANPPLWGYFGFPLNRTGVSVGVSKDGHNFSVVPPVPYFPPDGGSCRDVNLLCDYNGRPQRYNGLYFIFYTAGGFGGIPYFSIASTPDFKTWTHVTDVMVTGGGFNTVTTTGTATSGSTTLTVASSSGITIGMKACQPAQTTGLGGLYTVTAISGTTLTLSAATTGAVSGTIYFFNGNNTWSPFANFDASGTLRVFFRISTTPGASYAPPGIGYMTCSDPGTFSSWSNYTAVSGLDNNLNGPWIVRQGSTYYFFGDRGGAPDGHSDLYYYTSTTGVTGPYTAVGFLNGGNWSAFFGQNVESAQVVQTGANSFRCYLVNQATGNVYWSETTAGLSSTAWSTPVAVGFDDGMGLAAGCAVAFQNTDDQVALLNAAVGFPSGFHFRNDNNNLTQGIHADLLADAQYLKIGPTENGAGTMFLNFSANEATFSGGPLSTADLNVTGNLVGSNLISGKSLTVQNPDSTATSQLNLVDSGGTLQGSIGYGNATPFGSLAGNLFFYSSAPNWIFEQSGGPALFTFFMSGGGAGNLSAAGNLIADTAGKGVQIKEGSNARMGTATLSGGTVTVSNTSVTTNSRFFLTPLGSTINAVGVSAVTAGTSFTIKSASGSDTNVVDYVIFEPAP